MNETKLATLAQLGAFVRVRRRSSSSLARGSPDRYWHISGVLRWFRYGILKHADKGMVLRYLVHTTRYSRQQITRW